MIRHTCPITCISPESSQGKHYFFGYYDKQPWDARAQYLLAHEVNFCDRSPRVDEPARVGLIDLHNRSFEPIGETYAWNWQQGSQLQWLHEAGEQFILFNVRKNNQIITRIVNRAGETIREIDTAIYTVAPNGRDALALNYGRLSRIRPEYGYAQTTDLHEHIAAPEHDGVWHVDLVTGQSRFIVSIAQMAAHQPNPMGEGQEHYLNHLMFNPSGTRFCWIHRFVRSDGITQSRLFTANLDGSDMRLLIDGMCSHYHWRDDTTLLAWAGERKLLAGGQHNKSKSLMSLARKTLKPIYYAMGKPRFLMNRIVGDSYLLFHDTSPAKHESFAKGVLTCDGHCTWSPDGRWVLTDGYPDMKHRQPLFLWDVENEQAYEVGRYTTPAELDGEVRVDLHPRWSPDGTKVCIDSAMDGQRRIYVVDVTQVVR